jgi:phosphoenolpyruvate synthase/pyruvate phosphate dikinase
VTREVVREHVHSKDVQYLPDPAGRGAIRVAVPEELREIPCLDRAALEAVVDVGRRVERYFGSHQDVEWVIARGRELPEGLFVVQSRPVTAPPQRDQPPKPDSGMALLMSMFGADKAKS